MHLNFSLSPFLCLLLVFCAPFIAPERFYPTKTQKHNEIRGVWVATVENIDYPQVKGTDDFSYISHEHEILKIVQNAKNLGLNTIYFQIRPNSDALYKSKYECWSYWYTGKEGLAPENPNDDPLKILLKYAQDFSIDVHAWINPYRSTKSSVADNPEKSICENKTMRARFPEDSFEYPAESGSNYGDPGSPFVQDFILDVVEDILEKYAPGGSELMMIEGQNAGHNITGLAGLHLDDYFYPYPANEEIPDQKTFQKYGQNYGPNLTIEDWRRENVNFIIEKLQAKCHKFKILFGISPFGIYKTGQPSKIKGMSSPDEIYADTVEWLKRGIVDYIAPQLYWQDTPQDQSFTALVNYWATDINANPLKIPVLVGLATYRTDPINGKCPGYSPGEISTQIEICRETENCFGHIHFSNKYLFPEYRISSGCSSQNNFIDFEQMGEYGPESFSLYSHFKMSCYNFNRAVAVPTFYDGAQSEEGPKADLFDFDKEAATGQYLSNSNTIAITIDNLSQNPAHFFPHKIAIFMDFQKLLTIPVLGHSEPENHNFNMCRILGRNKDRAVVYCNLSDLVGWVPEKEAGKIDWSFSLVYYDFVYRNFVVSDNVFEVGK